MEGTALSIGKSVLSGALGYAKSALAEEVALQLGVTRDQAFIRDELEMMLSFLMAAHEERDKHKVVETWVKQVRVVAYDVEDSLMDFAIRVDKQSWWLMPWRIPRTIRDRRHVAKQMKDLRVKVEDVSQRGMRYRLIEGGSTSKATASAGDTAASAAAMFGVSEARYAAKTKDQPRLDLTQLINQDGEHLAVIAVWATSDKVGHTSIIWEAYESSDTKKNFPCRAWVRVMHPFSPKEFFRSLLEEFRPAAGVNSLIETEKTGQALLEEFQRYVSDKRSLIVLNGLSTIEEWNGVKKCFPINKERNIIIIVSTTNAEVASLCAGQNAVVSELKQLSTDQTIYAFYKEPIARQSVQTSTTTMHDSSQRAGDGNTRTKSSQDITYSTESVSSSTLPTSEIQEDQSEDGDGKMTVEEGHPRTDMAAGPVEKSQVAGREGEKEFIAKLILEHSDNHLEVIAVWGMGGIGKTTLVTDVYQRQDINDKFTKHAFVTVLRPFKLQEFLRSIAIQLDAESSRNKGAMDLVRGKKKDYTSMSVEDLTAALDRLSENRKCLIVVDDLLYTPEWDTIIKEFCKIKKAKNWTIVITTRQKDIAEHCCKKMECIHKLNILGAEEAHELFVKMSSQDLTYSAESVSRSDLSTSEIQEDQSEDADEMMMVEERDTRTNMTSGAVEESQLAGREREKELIANLILKYSDKHLEVIAVWGMGGIGKTTLATDVYQRQELNEKFTKRAFVTVLRPFKLQELLRSIAMQLNANSYGTKAAMDFASGKDDYASMSVGDLTKALAGLSQDRKCLIVIDDLLHTTEWDTIIKAFREIGKASWTIVITTRQKDIAEYCCEDSLKNCEKMECIHKLNILGAEEARELFIKTVFKKTVDFDKECPELVEPAKLILNKCDGLPLAIVTMGSFLAEQETKSAVEWRKLNAHITSEMEMNPKIGAIKAVLMKSYDGLPYYLKPCFLYMSIFPEDRNISRRRLVRRWAIEGYSVEARDKSSMEIADVYFEKLIERSMVLPTHQSILSRQKDDSCKLHDLIRDISISMSMKENLVFRLEEGCSSKAHGTGRHLAISSNWEGDEGEFQSIVELSRIRSLTVFGNWKPFYISIKMRFLRVLDLEDTEGLANHCLENIGKLLHLRYLSLRGCFNILFLPDSVGNLSHLEVLDIKGTKVQGLPKTIVKLRKLCHLHASRGNMSWDSGLSYCEKCVELLEVQRAACLRLFRDTSFMRMSRRDRCTIACCAALPHIVTGRRFPDYAGVTVPRGIRKVKSLHTLRYVHLAWGNAQVEEIKGLTGLRKLGVIGLSKKNSQNLCLAISKLSLLESLSLCSELDLFECMNGMKPPPENLQSLKLTDCRMSRLPEWIKGLQNLVKLTLSRTGLSRDGAAILMQDIGELRNLSILRLEEWGDITIGVVQFKSGLFMGLKVLHLYFGVSPEIESVKFDEGAMPKLEVLRLGLGKYVRFSGLEYLQSIKEVRVSYYWSKAPPKETFYRELREQLDKNKKAHVLKVD